MDALKLIAQDSLKADVSEAIKVGNTIKIWVRSVKAREKDSRLSRVP